MKFFVRYLKVNPDTGEVDISTLPPGEEIIDVVVGRPEVGLGGFSHPLIGELVVVTTDATV